MWWNLFNTVLICAAYCLYQSYYVYHIPQYKQVDKPRDTYDYIVVGGGSAGSVLAARLSENSSVSVLLLEAGPSDLGHTELDTPNLVANLWYSAFDWMFFSEPQKQNSLGLKEKRASYPRGRVLGGSSQINYMQWARGNRRDFDRWAELGCQGWSYKDVLPYFLKSEDIIPEHLAKDTKFRAKGGPMKITELKGYELCQPFVDALTSLGYKERDYNGENQEGVSRVQANIYKGERWSAARAYLWPAAQRENLDILTDSLVTKVDILYVWEQNHQDTQQRDGRLLPFVAKTQEVLCETRQSDHGRIVRAPALEDRAVSTLRACTSCYCVYGCAGNNTWSSLAAYWENNPVCPTVIGLSQSRCYWRLLEWRITSTLDHKSLLLPSVLACRSGGELL
ncbi:oxygen-dependent choline dehydrogenase [Elysia marginata]|uniref:Oxygen-dependent choline dehydrogenase n=1 Tax=Elysia marginata TaxID=1093978 RepID=A0AAV4FVJ5_9GAST|nr:oxygen-dependent choline dehydrogenase [Elysia marginata]